MPWYRVNGMTVHLQMGRGKAPASCRAPDDAAPAGRCGGISGFLCDWPVGDMGDTCDMPLCQAHAHEAGPDKHFCPKHKQMHKEISA